MSWFEWMGERSNPGPVGGFEVEDVSSPRRVSSPLWAIVRFSLALMAFVAVPVAVVVSTHDPMMGLAAMVGLGLYLVVSTLFTPRPDLTNMGAFGGLVDHPLRYSDDQNRTLFFLLVLTGPGRLLGSGVVDMFHLLAGHGDDDEPGPGGSVY